MFCCTPTSTIRTFHFVLDHSVLENDSMNNTMNNHSRLQSRFGVNLKTILLSALSWALFLTLNTTGVCADEPVSAFLSRLRETKHYDVAEFYLDQMEASNRINEETKKQIPFRRAQVLYEKTQMQRSDDAIESWKQAAKLANQYGETATTIDQKLEALDLVVRTADSLGLTYLRKSELPIAEVYTRPEFATLVREQIDAKVKAYQKGIEWLREDMKEARVSKDPERRAAVKDNSYRFLSLMISEMEEQFKLGQTLDPKSDEFKKLMTDLAASGAENRKKYSRYAPFEMYFQLIQVRALAANGKVDEAGPLLDDILLLTGSSYQPVQRQGVLEGSKLWFQKDPPLIELAVAKLEKIAAGIRDDEINDETAQEILLELAKAHHARVVATNDLEKPTSDQRTASNFSNNKSEKLLRQLVKLDSKVGDEAKALMKEWDLRGPAENVKDVATFSEARELGFNALTEARELQSEVSVLGDSAEDIQKREEITEQMQQASSRALAWFTRALELSDQDNSGSTRRADLNMTRVYQCQCYWMKKRYLEASLIGQFLLERFPNEIGSPEGASLAAQSINQMIIDGKKEGLDVSYEQQRLENVCQQVLKRWPERQEAGVVAYLLVTIAVDKGDLESAVAAVNQLSADNPKRGAAAMLVGLSHINKLRTLKQQGEVDAATAKSLEDSAQLFLSSALESPNTEPTVLYFYGVSQMAEIYNEQEQFDKTIQMIESAPASAIERIKNDDPLVSAPDLQVNMIQSDLLAHLGKMAQTGDTTGATERGGELLQLLSDKMANNPRRDAVIQSFYVLTLQKLKEQFSKAQQPEKLKALAVAVISIFKPLSNTSQDWKLLYSIGDTIAELRDRISDPETLKELNEVARNCFEKALKASQGSTDPNIAAYRAEFELGAAAALRADGKFAEAEKNLQAALKISAGNPKLQIELCQLYMSWGASTKDPKKLVTAINGAMPDASKKNQMWGWKKLAQGTINKDNLKEIFYASFYGLNRTKFLYTELTKENNVAKSALSEISKQLSRDPQMGGPGWFAKLDELTRNIQTQLGETVTGLKGL